MSFLNSQVIIEVEFRPISLSFLKKPIFSLALFFALFSLFFDSPTPLNLKDRTLPEVSKAQRVALLLEKVGVRPEKEIVVALSRQPIEEWKLLIAVATVESHFNPKARSGVGAIGLMQINPAVWKIPTKMLEDPEVNLTLGRKILNHYLAKCKGNLKCALYRYSGGAKGYYKKVINIIKKIQSPQPPIYCGTVARR